MKIMTVRVKGHGAVQVFAAVDEAGNRRMVPISAVTLEQWRKDKTLLAPWLLPSDLEDGQASWANLMDFLEEN